MIVSFNRVNTLENRVDDSANTKISELRNKNDKLAKKSSKNKFKKIALGSTRAARTVASTRRPRTIITSFLTNAGKKKK